MCTYLKHYLEIPKRISLKLTLKQIIIFIITVSRHGVPVSRHIFINDPLDFFIVLRVQYPGGACPELQRYVVALADAARREFEPLGEDAAAFVAGVIG